MDKHRFELSAMARKAPETDQLLVMFHAVNDMTREKAIGVAKDLCLHCCRLQQELSGAQALRHPQCAKCGGSGHLRRSWNNDYVDCDACDGRGH